MSSAQKARSASDTSVNERRTTSAGRIAGQAAAFVSCRLPGELLMVGADGIVSVAQLI